HQTVRESMKLPITYVEERVGSCQIDTKVITVSCSRTITIYTENNSPRIPFDKCHLDLKREVGERTDRSKAKSIEISGCFKNMKGVLDKRTSARLRYCHIPVTIILFV